MVIDFKAEERREQRAKNRYKVSAPVSCSAAIENVGRMKLAIEPFSDECPVMFEDGRYIQMRYKLDLDGNGKILVSILKRVAANRHP